MPSPHEYADLLMAFMRYGGFVVMLICALRWVIITGYSWDRHVHVRSFPHHVRTVWLDWAKDVAVTAFVAALALWAFLSSF